MSENISNPVRTCPICNSNDKKLLFNQHFSALENNLLDTYEIVVCNKCGFCFSDKIPNQEIFDIYYREMSKYEISENKQSPSKYDQKRFEQVVDYLLRKPVDLNSHIIEIGCSTGLLLSLLKNKGYDNLLGIDPSPSCVETVKKKYSIPSLIATITDLGSIKTESVDLVILVGVLEHIKDLDLALEEIRKVLKPDGQLFILVPDASQYVNGNDAPFQEFSVEHINYFGPGSLTNLMVKHRFTKLDIDQQECEVNYNTITPVILGLFKKNEGVNEEYKFDSETFKNLTEYIIKSHEREKIIFEKIDKIVNGNKPLIIWGTGAQTLRLLKNSNLNKANIFAFVDSNPKYQGKKLNGIPIINPIALKEMNEQILISTRAFQNEIEDQIRHELKLKNTIIKLY
jgi:SAM-dependent methyltransferase